ncbi:MAG TPA: hypothetical protein VFM05_04715 [Candidatus Saccharimonadales bacterium]|nr:hypothetical protein [Candidatus Saccharimonadales bacterium]
MEKTSEKAGTSEFQDVATSNPTRLTSSTGMPATNVGVSALVADALAISPQSGSVSPEQITNMRKIWQGMRDHFDRPFVVRIISFKALFILSPHPALLFFIFV